MAPTRRARIEAAARRVGLAAEVAAAAAGAVGLWDAHAAGRPVPRPAAIAFWAGLVGLVVSVAAPRVGAYVRARRRAA